MGLAIEFANHARNLNGLPKRNIVIVAVIENENPIGSRSIVVANGRLELKATERWRCTFKIRHHHAAHRDSLTSQRRRFGGTLSLRDRVGWRNRTRAASANRGELRRRVGSHCGWRTVLIHNIRRNRRDDSNERRGEQHSDHDERNTQTKCFRTHRKPSRYM